MHYEITYENSRCDTSKMFKFKAFMLARADQDNDLPSSLAG